MSKHAFTVVVAVIIAVSLLLYMFAFTVRSSEVAVVLTFGKPEVKAPTAGAHLKWPWPIQDVRKFDSRMIASEGRFEETYTQDRFNVITSLFIGWQIADAKKFNENFGRSDDYEALAWDRLERIVRDKALAALGTHRLDELVSVTQQPNYAKIEAEIKTAASHEAERVYGIEIKRIKIKRLELPESVTNAVYERMKAERRKQAQDIKSLGDQRAANIKSESEAKRNTILALARSKAEKIRGEGDAEAAEQYKEFAEYSDLAIFLRKIRALRETTRSKTTIIVDPSMPPFDVLTQSSADVKIPLRSATGK